MPSLRFSRLRFDAPAEPPSTTTPRFEIDATDPAAIRLVATVGDAGSIWHRTFDNRRERDAVVKHFASGAFNLVFHARVTMIFGPATIDAACDRAVENGRVTRRREVLARIERRRDARIIDLYRPDTKQGFRLELRRKCDKDAEWFVRYDRATERDRLCDWLRWQKPRFGAFLEHAAAHGAEALTRLLTDEMFATERRIRKEGRGAGGMRPLRVWRGD